MTLSPSSIALAPGSVLVMITVIVAPIATIAFARSGTAWKALGKGRFGLTREPQRPPRATQPAPSLDDALQAAEVRQMLEAKSYRRERCGGEPLDVEAEAARVLESASPRPDIDEQLRTEVRALVATRNERRLRRGQAPLDIEAETQRQLADLIGSD